MLIINKTLIIVSIISVSHVRAQLNPNKLLRRLGVRAGGASPWRPKILQNNKRTEQICYDTVGCFEIARKRSPLSKIPENPKDIDTKFFLFRKDIKFSHPEALDYDDQGKSVNRSRFDPNDPVKVIIHGYMSLWSDQGALEGVQEYLKICDCNVILMDWEKGARGPHYANAAANTEVVGRQLGILLLHMINAGLRPKKIHLIGFSLGAHVAGCASEPLKKRGHLIGRITGLDAASPLFRHRNLREKSKKLDKTDAALVDAIHTDASPFFADGFGLLEPIGHVDFFPNGGFEQPGCVDSKVSILVTHLEGALSREIICSHLRAWQLFLESLKQKSSKSQECEFIAYKCNGGVSTFQNGKCFPQMAKNGSRLSLHHSYLSEIGKLGEDVSGEGVMYLTTRGNYPFCGTQMQASIILTEKTLATNKGTIHMHLEHDGKTTHFRIPFQKSEYNTGRNEINGVAVTSYKSINPKYSFITASIMYIHSETDDEDYKNSVIYLGRIGIRDMYGHSWSYCSENAIILPHLRLINIKLNEKGC